ncbi:MAG: ROK family protein [Chloroflexi bacterium]|nr:ROK family protein [Chloroflexota bacterium]
MDAFLSFETGGTKLVAAVAGADGRLIDVALIERRHDDDAQQSLPRLLDLGESLLQKHRARGTQFRAVGFGYGGQFDRAANRVMECFHEAGWEDLDVHAIVAARFGLPTVIENDCKLAALAEAQLGAGRGFRTVFYITIGTGIGGGIVHAGHILQLGDKGEAEIGHMTVDPSGALPCACGKRGCLEAYCSGPGLIDLTRYLATKWTGPSPFATTVLGGDRFTGRDLFTAWAATDEFASSVVHTAAAHLGIALGATIQLLNPDVIILGGGVATGNITFLSLIENATAARVMPNLRAADGRLRTRFVTTELREQVVAQGAALLARQGGRTDSR